MRKMKKGVLALVFVFLIVGIVGTMIACQNKDIQLVQTRAGDPAQVNITETLYNYKDTFVGDNSKVSAIINALHYTDLPAKSIELQSYTKPYGMTINYKVDSRADYRFRDDIEIAWNKIAAVMFSLFSNMDEINIRIYDNYGTFGEPELSFGSYYYDRRNLCERVGMEHFTQDVVKESANSIDTFEAYLANVSAIINQADFYNEEQNQNIKKTKQIYSVIGDDSEITINSGTNFFVTISKEILSAAQIKMVLPKKGVSAEQYVGQKIEFSTYSINNFKTNQSTYYLFAFDGDKLIAYEDLKTSASERKTIGILSKLEDKR